MAFTRETRKQIRRRAKYRSEVTGLNTYPMESAHINHSRENPDYNSPDNGLLLRLDEHLYQHLCYRTMFEQDPLEAQKQLGLTHDQNEWAIERIYERLYEYETTGDYVINGRVLFSDDPPRPLWES